jgi:hypothetical protein
MDTTTAAAAVAVNGLCAMPGAWSPDAAAAAAAATGDIAASSLSSGAAAAPPVCCQNTASSANKVGSSSQGARVPLRPGTHCFGQGSRGGSCSAAAGATGSCREAGSGPSIGLKGPGGDPAAAPTSGDPPVVSSDVAARSANLTAPAAALAATDQVVCASPGGSSLCWTPTSPGEEAPLLWSNSSRRGSSSKQLRELGVMNGLVGLGGMGLGQQSLAGDAQFADLASALCPSPLALPAVLSGEKGRQEAQLAVPGQL